MNNSIFKSVKQPLERKKFIFVNFYISKKICDKREIQYFKLYNTKTKGSQGKIKGNVKKDIG